MKKLRNLILILMMLMAIVPVTIKAAPSRIVVKPDHSKNSNGVSRTYGTLVYYSNGTYETGYNEGIKLYYNDGYPPYGGTKATTMHGFLLYYHSGTLNNNVAVVCASGWKKDAPKGNEYELGSFPAGVDKYVVGQIIHDIIPSSYFVKNGNERYYYLNNVFKEPSHYYKNLLAVNYYIEGKTGNISWTSRTFPEHNYYPMTTFKIDKIVATAEKEVTDNVMVATPQAKTLAADGTANFTLKNVNTNSVSCKKDNGKAVGCKFENTTLKINPRDLEGATSVTVTLKSAKERYKADYYLELERHRQNVVPLKVIVEVPSKTVELKVPTTITTPKYSCQELFDKNMNIQQRAKLFVALTDRKKANNYVKNEKGSGEYSGKIGEFRNMLDLSITDPEVACDTDTIVVGKPNVEVGCFSYTSSYDFSQINLSNYAEFDSNKICATDETLYSNYRAIDNTKPGQIFARYVNYQDPTKNGLAAYIKREKSCYFISDDSFKTTEEKNISTKIEITNPSNTLTEDSKLEYKNGKYYFPKITVNNKVIGRGLATNSNINSTGGVTKTFGFKVTFNSKAYTSNCDVLLREGTTTDPEDFEFRIIDTDAAFPDRKTGSNWCHNKDCTSTNATIQSVITNSNDSYNKLNQNPMYKIILTPSDIKQIKKFNKTTTYDNSYEGDNKFIKLLKKGSGVINDVTINLSNKLEYDITKEKLLDLNDDEIYGDNKDLASAYQFISTYGYYNLQTSKLKYKGDKYIIPASAFNATDDFRKIGDVNGDKLINEKDTLALQKYLWGQSSGSNMDYVNAGECTIEKVKNYGYTTDDTVAEDFCFYSDMNGDGFLNDTDVDMLRKYEASMYIDHKIISQNYEEWMK